MEYRFIILLLVCMFFSCNKEEPPYIAKSVKVEEATGITETTAILSATLVSDGNFSNEAKFFVTEKIFGNQDSRAVVCTLTDGNRYSALIKDLKPGKSYYYRFLLRSYFSMWKRFTTLYDVPILSVVSTSQNRITLSSTCKQATKFFYSAEGIYGETFIEPSRIVWKDSSCICTVSLSYLKRNKKYKVVSFYVVEDENGIANRFLGNPILFEVDNVGNIHIQ